MTVTGFQLVRADIQGAVLNNAERIQPDSSLCLHIAQC